MSDKFFFSEGRQCLDAEMVVCDPIDDNDDVTRCLHITKFCDDNLYEICPNSNNNCSEFQQK